MLTSSRQEFDVAFPFALKSTRFGLFGPPNNVKRQELFVCIGQDDDGTSKYFQLTGKKRGNQLIREVVRTYARHISFDETTDLATKYFPFEHRQLPDRHGPCGSFRRAVS